MTEAARDLERGIEVVLARSPIVELRIHPEFTIEDIDRTYDELEGMVCRGERHIHWTDLRQVNPLAFRSEIRKRFAERERRLFELANGCILADVRIVDQQLIRGILTAFEWLVGQAPWPVRNVRSEAEAMAWLRTLDVLGP